MTILKKICVPILFPLKDPYGFAFLLNIVICACATYFTPISFCELSYMWLESFWSFSSFTLHIIMTLVCGYAVATSPAGDRFLRAVINACPDKLLLPLITLTVSALSFLNWGAGLLASGVLCRVVMQNGRKVHYPLLVIAAYSGFLVWHGGCTGSAPLLVASQVDIAPGVSGPIPLTETVFASWNLLLVVTIAVLMAALAFVMQYCTDKKKFTVQGELTPPHVHEKAPKKERVLTGISVFGASLLCIGAVISGMPINLLLVNTVFFSACARHARGMDSYWTRRQ